MSNNEDMYIESLSEQDLSQNSIQFYNNENNKLENMYDESTVGIAIEDTNIDSDNVKYLPTVSEYDEQAIPRISEEKSDDVRRDSIVGSNNIQVEISLHTDIYPQLKEDVATNHNLIPQRESTTNSETKKKKRRSSGGNKVRLSEEGTHVVEFKRGEKDKNVVFQAAHHFMNMTRDIRGSRFQNWTKAELVDLLISLGIEIRREYRIKAGSLRDRLDKLYETLPMPEKPKQPSFEELILLNIMARRIQNLWITYYCMKRIREEEAASNALIRKLQTNRNEHLESIMAKTDMGFAGGLESDVSNKSDIENNSSNPTSGQAMLALSRLDEEDDDDNSSVVSGFDSHSQFDTSKHNHNDNGGHSPSRPKHMIAQKKKRRQLNILDIEWTPPLWSIAQSYADYHKPRRGGKGGEIFSYFETSTGRHCCLGSFGEQFDLWQEGQISEFGLYGSGATNYFKFMKWCFWLFAILTIISLPLVVLNLYGPYEANIGLKGLAKTTAGNLAPSIANTTLSLQIPGCNTFLKGLDCNLTRKSMTLFVSYVDIAICSVIIIAFIWLKTFETIEEETLNKNTVNASMFTLMVSNIPNDCTEEEILYHFYNILGSEHKIFSVSIAYDNIYELDQCRVRGDLIRAKIKLVHKHRYDCTELRKSKGDKADRLIELKRKEFLFNMKLLNDNLKNTEQLLEELANHPTNALYAYLTFDRVSSRNLALQKYRKISFFEYCCGGDSLRLRGHLLKVKESSDPSSIIWENLGYSWINRMGRRTLTTFATLLLVVISLAITFGSKVVQTKAFNNQGRNQYTVCPSSFDSLTKTEQQEYITENPNDVHCYCNQFNALAQSRDPYCKHYVKQSINSQILQYFASLVVLMVNVLIESTLARFSSFEKHHTEDAKGESVFLRVFALKYINTCCVFFINNNSTILSTFFGYQYPTSKEFTSDWFNTIGVTVILVQIGDAVFAHSDKVYQWILYEWKMRSAKKNPETTLTQDDLNQICLGPKLEFALNYAQLLSTIFVCLTFSTGIPVLYMVAAGNFLLFYFVEKYLFIRLYRTPPLFNSRIGRRSSSLILFAIMIHLCVAIWVLTNSEIFYSPHVDRNYTNDGYKFFGNTIGSRITTAYTLPLFLLLCIVCVGLIGHFLVRRTWDGYDKLITALCGYRCAKDSESKDIQGTGAKGIVTFSRALQRNLIKGLATYNILQNPKYKEAFAITWKFAFEHTQVRSVRNLQYHAHQSEEESDASKAEVMQRNALLASSFKASSKPPINFNSIKTSRVLKNNHNNNNNSNRKNNEESVRSTSNRSNRSSNDIELSFKKSSVSSSKSTTNKTQKSSHTNSMAPTASTVRYSSVMEEDEENYDMEEPKTNQQPKRRANYT
eukprot:gene11622-15564_t